MAIVDTASPITSFSGGLHRHWFLGAPFDHIDQASVVELVRKTAPGTKFRYVVTPNVDHVIRLNGNGALTKYYAYAWMSLCDSRPIAALSYFVSLKLPLVTGSDLTAVLFRSVIESGDVVTLIAASPAVVRGLENAYPTVRFRAFIPPFGVWTNEQALQDCVDFVVREEARFVFIAIGSPQSEKIAHALSCHPDARGTGFCIGASLEFLIGMKKRAPLWMRRVGLEWLHRLGTDPKRLWRRYAYSVLPLLVLFSGEIADRQRRVE